MIELITNKKTDNFYNHFIKLLNTCDNFTFCVAFINFSGLQLLLESLKNCEKKNIRGKILTSTYLNFTQAKALEKIKEFSNIQLKIFNCERQNIGFHSKAYIFEFKNEYKLLLGSSNLTSSAFKGNIEWNIKTIKKKDDFFIKDIIFEFNYLWKQSMEVDKEFLEEYSKFQKENKTFIYKKEIKENYMQNEALKKLEFFRKNGEKKALCIAGTGTGKTYLAAFDVKNFKAKKVLFIVHRENILIKAKESFEKIISNKTFGLYTGNKKEEADYLFASIQSLNSNLKRFKENNFDYIILDEAHHCVSPSYKKVMAYFKSSFLLGLTATPNRMDEKSIYQIFDNNIACDIRLSKALEEKLVVPFHYYGVADIKSLDYSDKNINDVSLMAKFLMVNKRVDFIIEKMNFYSFSGNKRRVLAFCANSSHGIYMKEEFNKRGIISECLLANDSIIKREKIIKELESEDSSLKVIFTVDIFNEGVDIPNVNTILMLRPTNSPIVFSQQLGRGLRKSKNKEFLTIIDFIGNHNRAYLVSLALLGENRIDKDSIKLSLNNDYSSLKNAFIFIDEISKQRILDSLEKENFSSFKILKENYFNFKMQLERKPTLKDFLFFNEYLCALDYIYESKSYLEFVCKVEKEEELEQLIKEELFIKALRTIESMLPLKRIYEFVILLYLCENEKIDENQAFNILEKYLEKINKESIKHAFLFLNQNFLDKGQVSRSLKLVSFENNVLTRSRDFNFLIKNKKFKSYFLSSLEYGILRYIKEFSSKDYKMPFLKIYEKYNMLNIALLCNFNKIHSSFRGSGFLKFENNFFLFITMEKEKYSKSATYKNVFLSKEKFIYFSKPSHNSLKGDGYKLCNNEKEKIKLHVFVRKSVKVDKKTQGFIYLGLADTVFYEENRPIKCILKLQKPLNDFLYEEFTKII